MRIAVVHDYMDTMGGGEKLALILAYELEADFITTNLDTEVLENFSIEPSRVKNIAKLPSLPPLKQIWASWKFARFDYSDYDVVICSGNWSVFGASQAPVALWYCHTPCREFFDLRADMRQSLPWYVRIFFDGWSFIHRRFYKKAIKSVQNIYCNSYFTQYKIKKYIKKEAQVIYPPIEPFGTAKKSGKYWLAVSRIYPAKNIHLLVDIFRTLPHEQLIIIGDAGRGDHSANYLKDIEEHLPSNVKILSKQSSKEVTNIAKNAKAFISLAKNEDFGMGIAEALASGLPVVCSRGGGHEEIVENGKNGFIVSLQKNKIKLAIKNIHKIKKPRNLKDFSVKRFISQIKKEVKKYETYS